MLVSFLSGNSAHGLFLSHGTGGTGSKSLKLHDLDTNFEPRRDQHLHLEYRAGKYARYHNEKRKSVKLMEINAFVSSLMKINEWVRIQ